MQSCVNEKGVNYPKIPDKFAKYADEIKATVKETISFKLIPSNDSKLWQSKVGGSPYLPLEEKYPCNSKGVPLTFLMQVNFSEIPVLSGYPTEGIVEFYIHSSDDLLGLDYDNPTNQDGFRVLFFNTIEYDEAKLQLVVKSDNSEVPENYGPFEKKCSMLMEFCLEKQYITPLDYRFEKCFSFGEDSDIADEYMETLETTGHRIGGYPHFMQYDPRSNENFGEYELFLQLDTDDNGIRWGELGVGAFFIHPNDLKQCDFSKVLFNWDCI